jgi:isoaspartyl peptidase/L-asparaginase-like protein (Ntn-hydrolase superfamily)
VKIAAPGDSLVTVYPALRYASVSGTSFSSGLASGGAALLAQVVPALDFRLAGRYLDDGALKRVDLQLGDGRLNLRGALQSAPAAPPPPPPPPPTDTTPPTVAVTSLSGGGTVTGVVSIGADASDNVGVVGVQFTIDGGYLGAEYTSPPYALQWDSTSVANGTHVVGAVARDAAGNVQTATTIGVTVINDTVRPSIALTDPIGGAVVNGLVMLAVTASDNVGVAGVQFTLDGVGLAAEDVTAPYSVTLNSATLPNGTHTVGATARDMAGNIQAAAPISITVNNDLTAPTVAVLNPATGAMVAGSLTITASASDDVGVVGVQFTVDGANLGPEHLTAPYTMTWNSASLGNGTHAIGAVARDAAGNVQAATAISVTVDNDLTAPTVAVLNPDAGATIAGSLALTANASDNVGVVGVQFTVDGVNLGAEDLAAPYSVTWNSASLGNGPHTIAAIARDAAGNAQTAAAISVTVDNDTTPPTIALVNPTAGATVAGSLMLDASASDNVGVVGVQFTVDGVNLGGEDLAAPYATPWNSVTLANGSHVIGAIARDAAGNVQAATAISITVDNDVTAPTVAVLNPADEGPVTGSAMLEANASDNVGIVGVQFMIDGENAGAEDVTAPYAVPWNSLTVANGTHTIGAIARDAAGNVQTATPISFIVDNDLTVPTVEVLNPEPGAIVAGLLTLEADAADNVAVVGVQFTLDGVNLGTERTTAPYDLPWNSLTVANGAHTIGAIARDAAGNVQTATALSITVNNDLTAPSVEILSPGAGTTLAGSVTLDASASDDVAVVGVQFTVDGVNVGGEVVTPYSVTWNSTTLPNGTHTIGAIARDAAGNIQVAAPVTVTVNNDTTAPTVAILNPGVGATVHGALTLSADASDDVGVVGVQFVVDGVNVGAEITAAPYQVVWNSESVTDGPHVVTAVARDAAGNQLTASAGLIVANTATIEGGGSETPTGTP